MQRDDNHHDDDDRTSDGDIGWRDRKRRFNISLRRISREHMQCITVGTGVVLAALAAAILATAAVVVLVGIRYFLD